jgi:hypothetical protein
VSATPLVHSTWCRHLGELLHEVNKALSLLSEQTALGHAHVLKEQFSGVLGLHTHLIQLLALLEPRGIGLHQEQRDALGALRRIGLGADNAQIGHPSVGNEGLRAVDDVVVAIFDGSCSHALEVRAGAGFSHGDSRHPLTTAELRETVLLLLLGTYL